MTRRVRTHVNPLASRGPVVPPDWGKVFPRVENPWVVEFGPGKGRFLLAHAEALPGYNIVGIEVRKPLVERLAEKIRGRNLDNAFVYWGNVAPGLPHFFPPGVVETCYALFPDPWAKRRHEKRRLFAGDFLDRLAPALRPGAEFRIATDQAFLAEWILHRFETHPAWENVAGRGRLASERAAPFRSAWEDHCLRTGRPVFWMRFRFLGS